MAGNWLLIFALILAPQGEPSSGIHSEGVQDSLDLEALLATCREGILDPQARPEDRRRWVQLLFSYDAPQSNSLIVELLTLSARPEVQRAACIELAAKGRSDPHRMDRSFVDPLMRLLGVQAEELRIAAAKALAEFQDSEVVSSLGELAANRESLLPARLAAIQALAGNTHRRDVVEQLVGLLDAESPEVSERVVAALEPIGPAGVGADPAAWREWWQEKKDMGQESWLSEQARLYRDRARRLSSDLISLQAERDRDQAAMTTRVRDLQREILRGLSPEQRDAKLVEWLDDPLPMVKAGALAIVKARIADEGRRPEGDILAALLRAINNESPSIRREVLSIAQNLQDRVVVDAVLEQLEREPDPPTRLVILESLGKLGDAAAVPALIGEITAGGAEDGVVREAARAIARIASKREAKAELASSATPLQTRYRAVPPEQTELQAALLTAMAGVADPSFASDFATAIDSEDPTILQAAISGLAAIRDATKLSRVRVLATHPDPRVRLAAVEAIAVLGGEDPDLEILQARLFPNAEANELVRQAAWKAWRDFVARRTVPERLKAADRLRELPDLEVEYLDDLTTSLEASGNHKAALQDVRQRLVQLLVAAGKHAEAVPRLRDLYEAAAGRSDPQAWAIGLRWLDAVLKTPNQQGLADLIVRLSRSAADDQQRAKIVESVRAYVDSPAIATDPDRARRLSADLATVDAAAVGNGWRDLLVVLDSRLKAAGNGPAG